ncbi:hypothetical protein ACS0TY_000699 [Phlomoides rotata]
MDTRSRSTRVLMFPWLAHGHISPFLQLAKSLAKRNFVTYICSSQINLNSLKKKISTKDAISIKLVELLIPTTPELPPHYHTTNGLPPHLMGPLKKALDEARPAFATLLSTLGPDLVIYDFLQPWAPEEAASHNIPAVLFFSAGAGACSLMLHHFVYSSSEFPFPEIHFKKKEHAAFSHLEKDEDERVGGCFRRSCDVVLIKSFREMEGKYMDFLSALTGKKFVPVGPLVPREPADEGDRKHDHFVEWLDGKGIGTTVFVSFGTEYFLSEKEIEEIAHGLEMSGVNFIWVVRFPLSERAYKIEERLPLGFVERVGGRGMVVEGWAPQRVILSHPSVGGFLSHCGWSSVMEGLYSGVPIIALPMQLDQPLNARVVAEVGVGEEVVRGGVEGSLERREVARVVRKLMVEESGEPVRRRVAEMSERMRRKGEEEIDGVVEEMVRLCWKGGEMNIESEDYMMKLNRMIEENEEERRSSENTWVKFN